MEIGSFFATYSAPMKPENFEAIALCCQNSNVGKLLPSALYVHISALSALDPLLVNYELLARQASSQTFEATLIKFNLEQPKISYLFYPEFDRDPHPALHYSFIVDTETLETKYLDYQKSDNPPILHRKETFVTPDYPLYDEFAQLTTFELALGLLDNSRFIGNRQQWQQLLEGQRIYFQGHRLICPVAKAHTVQIERQKAAMHRKDISRPVRLAQEAELFTPQTTFFDYGCGFGSDVEKMQQLGYSSVGWDPYYFPNNEILAADIVNLGYVINVIEDSLERRQALIKAWEITKRVLLVSAQVLIDHQDRGLIAYADGIITSRNTFQKYYEQEELKTYIDHLLGVEAIPVSLGIYFVFKDLTEAENFRATRFHTQVSTPKIQVFSKRFEDYQDMLKPLMGFITERGRLPVKKELLNQQEIIEEFGTIRRAFQVVLQVTDNTEWETVREKRREELLLYLALSRFSHRPKPRELKTEIKEDFKALFGSYQEACWLADKMFLRLRDLKEIEKICQASIVGKKLNNSLLIHIRALKSLDPLLRLYEACASEVIGKLDQANAIKLSWKRPRISYLYYPNFDLDPHPCLKTVMEVSLSDLRVKYHEYDLAENPPILHEKETLISKDYPLYEKFAKLTRQEKDWGLLDEINGITNLKGWQQRLLDHCAEIQSYRLVWRKDADPYKVKLLKSLISSRRAKV